MGEKSRKNPKSVLNQRNILAKILDPVKIILSFIQIFGQFRNTPRPSAHQLKGKMSSSFHISDTCSHAIIWKVVFWATLLQQQPLDINQLTISQTLIDTPRYLRECCELISTEAWLYQHCTPHWLNIFFDSQSSLTKKRAAENHVVWMTFENSHLCWWWRQYL